MKRIKFNIQIPANLKKLNDAFNRNNVQIWIVGGSVRDALLKKQPKDWDCVTEANPTQIMEILRKENIKFLDKDLRFGVIRAYVDGEEFEIVTTREDIGKGRRPDAVKFTNLKSDASRRDLTINSLYYDMNKREIIDYFGGVDDILKSRIRTVGNPNDRYEEDKLRKMRSIRFAGVANSELDPEIVKSFKQDNSLEGVSNERIRDEFIKSIHKSVNVNYVVGLFNEFGFLKNNILPNLNVRIPNNLSKDEVVTIAAMTVENDIEKLRKELNKLTYSHNEISQIVFLNSLVNFNINGIIILWKLKTNSGITNKQIDEFGKIMKLNPKLLTAIKQYEYTPTKLDIKPGPEYGKEINRLEIEKFKQLYL